MGHFGGFVARYLGDGVLVYFGYPHAHEDDAERAVRAGLELITSVAGLKTCAARRISEVVDGRTSAAYGDNQRFVQVIVEEFPVLVIHYPILLSKDAQTGRFYCGAMLGFDEGENLFLEAWTHGELYRPLNLQRGPFYANGTELAIDLDNPRVGAEGGEPLFTEQGQPTRYLQSIIWSFQNLKPGLEMTKIFITRLLELKLIEPVDIEVRLDDGSARKYIDLYTIDQEVLERLPDAVVVELFRRGYMRLIYYMIASLKHIPLLANKKNSQLLEATRASRSAHAGNGLIPSARTVLSGRGDKRGAAPRRCRPGSGVTSKGTVPHMAKPM